MVEEEELMSNATGATSGGTYPSNVGRGKYYQCIYYKCGQLGHMSWGFQKNTPTCQRSVHVAQAKEEDVNTI